MYHATTILSTGTNSNVLSNLAMRASLIDFLAINAPRQTGLTENSKRCFFTYISNPNFCLAEYGYVVPAFCTAPGELPHNPGNLPNTADRRFLCRRANFGALRSGRSPMELQSSIHQYSTPSGFQQRHRKGPHVFVGKMDEKHPHSRNRQREPLWRRTPTGITDPSSTLWAATDDDILYGIGCFPCVGSQSPSQVYQYRASTGRKTVLIDYATDGHGFTGVGFGGTGDLSSG